MDYQVIITTPHWTLGGVSVYILNLARGLKSAGVPVTILLTRPDLYDPKPFPKPKDLPFDTLPVPEPNNMRRRWQTLIDYLESKAPCIYIPNHDYFHSCVSPVLSDRVKIVGVLHSDEKDHYNHAMRLGKYWDSIVCVSKKIENTIASKLTHEKERIQYIPHGVKVSENFTPAERKDGDPLRILYTGRLKAEEKRLGDIMKIVQRLTDNGIDVLLTMAGGGTLPPDILDLATPLLQMGKVKFLGTLSNDELKDVYSENHIFLLTSQFEGFPISLIEAMSFGCIPVATDIESGIPEMIVDDQNGYRIPVGDIGLFVERISEIEKDARKQRQMSIAAYESIRSSGFDLDTMVLRYKKLFDQIFAAKNKSKFERPKGKIRPPIFLRIVGFRMAIDPYAGWLFRLVRKIRGISELG